MKNSDTKVLRPVIINELRVFLPKNVTVDCMDLPLVILMRFKIYLLDIQ
jgi:hypothetical protein